MFKINLVNLPSPLKIKMDYKFPEVLPVKLQKKEVQPRTVSQLVYPDSGFNGLSEVSINAVTNEIDENIKSENIKKDVSILGVQGNIEELKGTKLEITKNGTYTPEEPYNAFTEVDVNMADVSEYFRNTIKSEGVIVGLLKLVKTIPMVTITGTTCQNMFKNSGITHLPLLDTSNIVSMESMLQGTRLSEIPAFDTSNVTNFEYFCNQTDSGYAYVLSKIPLLNFSKAVNVRNLITENKGLTDLGGFQNLGQAYDTTKSANHIYYQLKMSDSTRLTHDSLMNVGNNLYDIASKGCNTQQVIIGSTNMKKLTPEELLVFTNKGWTVS